MVREQHSMQDNTTEQFMVKAKDFKEALMQFQPKMKTLNPEVLLKLQRELCDLSTLLKKTINSNSLLLQLVVDSLDTQGKRSFLFY